VSNKFRLPIVLGSIALCFVTIFGFGWWLLTSTEIVNTSLAIKARHYYYFNLAPKLGQNLGKLPFAIIAMQEVKAEEGIVYAYMILGRYEDSDWEKQILYLKTKDGQTYGYNYSDSPGSELVFQEWENGIIRKRTLSTTPLSKGDKIFIQWTDKRTLGQILLDAGLDQQKLLNPDMDVSDFQRINRL